MASFNERVSAEWNNVSDQYGNAFVPDVSAFMPVETMQTNLSKLDYWIGHYSTTPVPSNLVDLYNKEVSGKGNSITNKVKEIIAYLTQKKAAYVQAIADAQPKTTVQNETTNNSQNIDQPEEADKNITKQENKLPVQPEGFSTKKWIIIGVIGAVVILGTAIVIKKYRSK